MFQHSSKSKTRNLRSSISEIQSKCVACQKEPNLIRAVFYLMERLEHLHHARYRNDAVRCLLNHVHVGPLDFGGIGIFTFFIHVVEETGLVLILIKWHGEGLTSKHCDCTPSPPCPSDGCPPTGSDGVGADCSAVTPSEAGTAVAGSGMGLVDAGVAACSDTGLAGSDSELAAGLGFGLADAFLAAAGFDSGAALHWSSPSSLSMKCSNATSIGVCFPKSESFTWFISFLKRRSFSSGTLPLLDSMSSTHFVCNSGLHNFHVITCWISTNVDKKMHKGKSKSRLHDTLIICYRGAWTMLPALPRHHLQLYRMRLQAQLPSAWNLEGQAWMFSAKNSYWSCNSSCSPWHPWTCFWPVTTQKLVRLTWFGKWHQLTWNQTKKLKQPKPPKLPQVHFGKVAHEVRPLWQPSHLQPSHLAPLLSATSDTSVLLCCFRHCEMTPPWCKRRKTQGSAQSWRRSNNTSPGGASAPAQCPSCSSQLFDS